MTVFLLTEAKTWWRKREEDYVKMLLFLDLKGRKPTIQMKKNSLFSGGG